MRLGDLGERRESLPDQLRAALGPTVLSFDDAEQVQAWGCPGAVPSSLRYSASASSSLPAR
jgi:hypothetical protein